MADSGSVVPPSMNGMPMDDDEFERNIKEIMEDAPDLDDLSSTVQSGSPQKAGSGQSTYSLSETSLGPQGQSSSSSQMSRSLTLPLATSPGSLPKSHSMNGGDFSPKPTMTQQASNKLEQVKNWSINTYKCTRQLLSEKLGKSSRTVDLELESQIEVLRDTQRKYANILRLSRSLANNFYQVVQTQRALGEAFSEQAQRAAELQDEFTYNCETQRALVKNGEVLLGAINFFTSSVNTLCNKTMEDTLTTVKNYETARLEFDAYRADMDHYALAPKDATNIAKAEETKRKFDEQKIKYDKLRSDVAIKLKFLDENRVKVMHKQLLLFHNAISAYFSGNQEALEATLKQFSIKLKAPNSTPASWLEQ